MEFPSPREGKKGWPWENLSRPLPETMPDGRPWPRISIVTPSYNQGKFIEETIRSVLLQGYPNLEYIIIDGGSTDNSVDIIRKYESWLTYWVSEKDRGQSHAINKGWRLCTGEWFNWLCSDDILTPGALEIIAREAAGHECDIIAGATESFGESAIKPFIPALHLSVTRQLQYWKPGKSHVPAVQPSTFFKRSLLREPDLVREDLHFAMANELWIRFQVEGYRRHNLNVTISRARCHPDQKTHESNLLKRYREFDRIFYDYTRRTDALPRWKRLLLWFEWGRTGWLARYQGSVRDMLRDFLKIPLPLLDPRFYMWLPPASYRMIRWLLGGPAPARLQRKG